MKKITMIAVAALLAVSFTSCKKDYTCECKYPNNSGLNSSSVIKTTKSDAKTKCETLSNAAKGAGGSCALK